MSLSRRYLRKKLGGPVFPWTDALAARSDMYECDGNGKEIISAKPVRAESEPKGLVIPPEPGEVKTVAEEEFAEQFAAIDSADLDGLKAMAQAMGLSVHHNAKVETIRKALKEAIQKQVTGEA